MTLGIIFGIAAGALWGLTFIIPFVLSDTPAELLAIGRFGFYALASIVLLIPHFKRLPQMLNKHKWFWLFFLAITGNSLYYVLMVEAARLTGVSITSIIIGTLPVTIALCGARSWGEVKKFSSPLLIILLGIVIIQWPLFEAIFKGTPNSSFKGSLLAVAAHLSWLLFALYNAKFLKKHTEISPKIWAELLGVASFITLFIYILFKGVSGSFDFYIQGITAEFIYWSFALGVFASVFANWFWNEASRRLPTTLAGQLVVSETIFAILYECFYLRKLPFAYEALALVILIVGVIWASRVATQN